MANELTKLEQHLVSKGITDKEMLFTIKNQIAPGISDADLHYCLTVAKKNELDPIAKEIYFVPRKAQINGQWVDKYEPMTSVHGARKIARDQGFKGVVETHSEIKEVPQMTPSGWEMKKDLIGVAELKLDGETYKKEVYYSEYVQTTKSGDVTKFWKTKPHTMIQKVAEFQLLRSVFGINVMNIDEGLVENKPKHEVVNENLEKAKSEKVIEADVNEEQGGLF